MLPDRGKLLAGGFDLFRFLLLCLSLSLSASAADLVQFDRVTLFLDPGDGSEIEFSVELATTPQQHARGLMFRDQLAPDAGMLFVFSQDGKRSFWMKDTFIPLDMLFFDSRGAFVSMIRNAEPESLAPRRSDGPAKYVLELNGGAADRLGIGQKSHLFLPIAGVDDQP